MHLVAAKCTQCNANLEVDSTQDAAVCNFCKTPFITDKAIKNYNTYSTTHQHITAGVVNVVGSAQTDFEIRAGVLEKYIGASSDVIIPDGVTVIGKKAFKGCKGLKSIIIPNSVTSIEGNGYEDKNGEWVEDGAFKDCIGLTSIVIPNKVTEIETYTFSGCINLTSITIPNGVTEISLSGCKNMMNITIPNSVKSLYLNSFTALTSITIPNSVESLSLYRCTGLTDIIIPSNVYSFSLDGCENLVDVTISNGVEEIGHLCFRNCKNIKSITIPNSVKTIVDSAFVDCSGLVSVNIPNSVTSIGKYYGMAGKRPAFDGCYQLKDVKISSNLWRQYNDNFVSTPFYRAQKEEEQRRQWQAWGRCYYCGGVLGFFKKCKSCGEKN
jgi:hypothetical protein